MFFSSLLRTDSLMHRQHKLLTSQWLVGFCRFKEAVDRKRIAGICKKNLWSEVQKSLSN